MSSKDFLVGVKEEGALAGPRLSFLHSLYPTNSQRHLLGGTRKCYPQALPKASLIYWRGKDSPQTVSF